MEEKKKSSFGKAFSRTFSRKSTPSAPVPAPAPVKPVEPVAAPAPAAAVAAAPTNGASALAPAASNGSATPLSPISIPTPNLTTISPPDSTPVSRVGSPSQDDSSPKSPLSHSTHLRDSTIMSNASTASRQGGLGAEESGEGLNPTDILLNRLEAFRAVIKNLQQYYTELAQVETTVSKATHKASGVIVVPFKDGQQFMGKGGLQDVCIGIRDSAKTRSDQHASTARFLEETIIKNLRRLKQDIKAKVKALKSDTNLYSSRVFKERELTQERIAQLAKAIGLFEMGGHHQPDMEKVQSDPYVINLALKRQLVKQVHEENLFAHALKQCQDQMATFEAHIIKELKQILSSFAEYQLNNSSHSFSQTWAPTELALNVLQEESEWTHFLERHGHQLFPSDLVDANPEEVDYPCKDSPYVTPVRTAHLSRQSSVLKNWKEGYFVLTLAGWLHVFPSADISTDAVPDHSIYIPTSTLGPHSESGQKQHIFSLDGKGKGGLLHRDSQTFTLRAHSREEMLEWWSEISKRAQSSTFTQPGDGSIEALSRAGSIVRSSSVVQPKSPEVAHAQVPSPAYVAQEVPLEKKVEPVVAAASPVPAAASPIAAAAVVPAVAEPAPVQEKAPVQAAEPVAVSAETPKA